MEGKSLSPVSIASICVGTVCGVALLWALSVAIPLIGLVVTLIGLAAFAWNLFRGGYRASRCMSPRAPVCETPDNCLIMRAHTGRPYCATCQTWLA